MSATRRELLAGAAVATPLALAAPAAAAGSEELERLLALERELEAAYAAALGRGAIDPALGRRLLAHEREHVRGLRQALGPRGPKATAPPPLTRVDLDGRTAFARSALDLERRAVDSYRRVLPVLRDDRLRQPLGSIMACGAQHEVALRDALGEPLLGRN